MYIYTRILVIPLIGIFYNGFIVDTCYPKIVSGIRLGGHAVCSKLFIWDKKEANLVYLSSSVAELGGN